MAVVAVGMSTTTMTIFFIIKSFDIASFQETLRILDKETSLLVAFSKDLLDLEKAYVTRIGDECGMPTHKSEINYFCRETQGSMDNLINAISQFHTKLNKWVGHCYDTVEHISMALCIRGALFRRLFFISPSISPPKVLTCDIISLPFSLPRYTCISTRNEFSISLKKCLWNTWLIFVKQK